MAKISRETPLSEITLRKYENPASKDIREIAKKTCLSLGILMPGDYRDIIVDILLVLRTSGEPLRAKDIEKRIIELRKEKGLTTLGTASSNIRRQIRRLKSLYLVESFEGRYRIFKNLPLHEIWQQKIMPVIVESACKRIEKYLKTFETLAKQ